MVGVLLATVVDGKRVTNGLCSTSKAFKLILPIHGCLFLYENLNDKASSSFPHMLTTDHAMLRPSSCLGQPHLVKSRILSGTLPQL